MRLGAAIVLCIPLILSAGCDQFNLRSRQAPPVQKESDPTPDADHLSGQLQAARDENTILSARLEEQLSRERLLSDRLTSLKFLNRRQQEQIKALSDAPGERDALRRRNDELSAEIARLNARIKELAAEVASLKSAHDAPSRAGQD